MSKTVLAIVCGDIHLSQTKPAYRSLEKDWYAVMAGYLDQLKTLAKNHNCAVLCAGDVFHTWYSPPELINFAIENLPTMYSIRGNHDLPDHRNEDVRRSAYWTLVEAGKLIDLTQPKYFNGGKFGVHPFSYGIPIVPNPDPRPGRVDLALAHSYIWMEGFGHSEAAETDREYHYQRKLAGYTLAAFGDNHHGFLVQGKPSILNCGTFLIRRSDESDCKPQVGIVYSDGTFGIHYLDTSKDVYIDSLYSPREKTTEMDRFHCDLTGVLKHDSIDVEDRIRRALEAVNPNERVCGIVLESIGGKR